MADDNVSVESVEITLLSDIGVSSATMMKDAYLPSSGEPYLEEGPAGPNALVYVTKISNRTPDEEIEDILRKDPDTAVNTVTHDFYTVILIISMQLGDPTTTRFINGTINVEFPQEIQILDYSPKDKSSITTIIENCGGAISISPGLVFLASASRSTKNPSDRKENRFGILVGSGETITGTYNKKTGYSLDIAAFFLLEYQGMLKNKHDMIWEIYPPMPPHDREINGEKMMAVFSLIVQTPKRFPPEINASIECRVKGNLWGVIPIKGSIGIL
jgi:hypothetical protein